ncbi:hypothetical protein RJ639_018127 [Escallonia herrerae]|uniref:Uncharacterized protein n=1 Tax=Escallonia herrerae TaxID=1293975 RepID=A0AA88V695_9ASTE|nr:hypothetical protein RJ639_018127 [Escallonia herrerae]
MRIEKQSRHDDHAVEDEGNSELVVKMNNGLGIMSEELFSASPISRVLSLVETYEALKLQHGCDTSEIVITAGFDHGAFELMQEKVIAKSYNLMKSVKDAYRSYILLCNSHPIKDVFDVHRLDLQRVHVGSNTAPEKSRLLRDDTEFHPQILKTDRADVKSIYKNSPATGFYQSKQSRY